MNSGGWLYIILNFTLHFHVVVHVNQPQADGWSEAEVMERWHMLFSGIALSRRYLAGEALSKTERQALSDTVVTWRQRLADVSWFMRCLNEPIARQANSEDGCTGRFWEGRFRSQALLDEAALAACLAYVDLNPVRAGKAETPESSAHTSVQRRVLAVLNRKAQPEELQPFVGYPQQDQPNGLPFRLNDYLELVDWTGRILREDKRGAISEGLPPILERLNIEPKYWLYMTRHFESRFKHLVGAAHRLKQACTQLGYQRTPGLRASMELLN